MFESYAYYGLTAVTVCVIAMYAVMQTPPLRNIVAPVTFVVFLFVSGFAGVDLLSRPRPVEVMPTWMRPDVDKAEVLASQLVNKERIYVLLMWDELKYPQYFSYPWNKEMAEQLQEAMRGQQESGDKVEMILPFDPSLEKRTHPWVHQTPQPDFDPAKRPEDVETIIPERPSVNS